MTVQQRTALNQMLRDSPLAFGGDIAEQRRLFDQTISSRPLPADVCTAPIRLATATGLSVSAGERSRPGHLLYFHGGAYVFGAARLSVGLAGELARRTGRTALTMDYRLAPEHPFPAAVDDGLTAYRELLDSGVAPQDVVVSGESAGGGLAMAVLLAARDAGLAMPAGAALMSPFLDLTLSGASVTANRHRDPLLDEEGIRLRVKDYLGAADPSDPLASPLFADLTGLPPIYAQAGSIELVRDDAVRLVAKAAAADVSAVLDVTSDVPHVFQSFADVLDEGGHALDRLAAFISAVLDKHL